MTDPINFTDGYPRDGCVIAVDVQASGYEFSIRQHGGKEIEWYHARTPVQMSRMIKEWCEGKVPWAYDKSDQSASANIPTNLASFILWLARPLHNWLSRMQSAQWGAFFDMRGPFTWRDLSPIAPKVKRGVWSRAGSDQDAK